MIRSTNEVYQSIEEALRESDTPMTCVSLMDNPKVRDSVLAEFGPDVQLATNKLSDMLGFMWRRGVINRYPAPRGGSTKARFAYGWPAQRAVKPPQSLPPSSKKPVFKITEGEREVVINFEHVTIIVRKE